ELPFLELPAPIFQSFFHSAFGTVIARLVVNPALGQIGLGHIAAFIVMGVLVTGSVPQRFCGLVRSTPKMARNSQDPAFFDVSHCFAEADQRAIAFWRRSNVDRRMRQRNLSLW